MDIFLPNTNVLIIGAPKSGKTTFIIDLIEKYRREQGKTVLVRDIGDYFEYLALCKTAVDRDSCVVALIPEGCDFTWKTKGLEKRFYNPGDMMTLFDAMKVDEINVLFADLFITGIEDAPYVQMKFWSAFFNTMLSWKNSPGNGELSLAFIFDEFNDIAPGKHAFTMPNQGRLVNGIAKVLKDFRRANIKFVASTHTYDMIAGIFRRLIDNHVIKKNSSSMGTTPTKLQPYAHMFSKIAVDECWFFDQENIQGPEDGAAIETPVFIPTHQYRNVVSKGSINHFFVTKAKEAATPKEMAAAIVKDPDKFMDKDGKISYKLVVAEFDRPLVKVYSAIALAEKELGVWEGKNDEVGNKDSEVENLVAK